jgi:hypothetical protein
MSDLKQLAEHARRMSMAQHRDDCRLIHRITKVAQDLPFGLVDYTRSCAAETGHEIHDWIDSHGLDWTCPGLCGGCLTNAERTLWTQIADEIDAYLGTDQEEALW